MFEPGMVFVRPQQTEVDRALAGLGLFFDLTLDQQREVLALRPDLARRLDAYTRAALDEPYDGFYSTCHVPGCESHDRRENSSPISTTRGGIAP